MKKEIRYLVTLIAVVMIFGAAVMGYRYLSSNYGAGADAIASTGENAANNKAAPDFTVTDMEGNEVNLSDYAGKPVIINFWASWCPPCAGELPDFDEAYKEYGEDVVFMMVNLTDGSRETVDGVKEYIEEKGYEFPVYFDTLYSGAAEYSVSSIPMTVLVGKDGNEYGRRKGAISGDTLTAYIEMLLEEKE